MSTTTPTPTPVKIPNWVEAAIWVVASFLLYFSAGGVPVGAPVYVREIFAFIGAALPAIKYALMQTTPPNIPVGLEAVLAFVIYLLSGVSGIIASQLGSSWYVAIVGEVIAAVIGVYVAMGGTSANPK